MNNVKKPKDIAERTFKYAVSIINLAESFPKNIKGNVLTRQIIRSGTSVGANTEEAQNSLTKKEFIKSMTISLKETRETRFWLRLAGETNCTPRVKVNSLVVTSQTN